MSKTEFCISTLIDNSQVTGQGTVCRFIQLTGDMGIKLYDDPNTRDEAMHYQQLAANHGLGPMCYGPYDHEDCWGYLTEVVAVMPNEEDGEPREFTTDEIMDCRKLIKEARKVGISKIILNDIWEGNIGWKNSKMILIDFDCELPDGW